MRYLHSIYVVEYDEVTSLSLTLTLFLYWIESRNRNRFRFRADRKLTANVKLIKIYWKWIRFMNIWLSNFVRLTTYLFWCACYSHGIKYKKMKLYKEMTSLLAKLQLYAVCAIWQWAESKFFFVFSNLQQLNDVFFVKLLFYEQQVSQRIN
jgi:hypothetical protein